MRRFWLAAVLPVLIVAALVVVPLASGARTLFLRDVFNTHLGLRAFLADSLRHGELPLVDPLRAGGQGLVGNPNALPLYPDNLLLLVSSTIWQLNAHFWLHWLLALAAATALGRAWGLGRQSAFAAGTIYAFSGYFLSQLNLYNGVAGAALAPALAAALLRAAQPERRGRALAMAGAVWALLLLGGDPVLAALALLVSVALALGGERRPPWTGVALALVAGTLIAAPQLVEMLRLLPTSFRGFWGNDLAAQSRGTPDPMAALDLLVPLFFGRPDFTQSWGTIHFGDALALYFSLAPGLLALAALRSGWSWHERRGRVAGLVLLVAGALTYSSGWAGKAVAMLPGGGLFRLPVKFALGAALAGSLLAGLGLERAGADPALRERLRRTLLVLGALELALFFFFVVAGNALEGVFRTAFAASLTDGEFADLRRGWGRTAAIQLLVVAVGLWMARRGAPGRARTANLALAVVGFHAATQLLLLRGMLPTDEAAFYQRPPALLARLPPDDVLAHGGVSDLFVRGYPRQGATYPDAHLYWLERRGYEELFSYPALLAGRRFEFNVSPEGLDSFLVQAVGLGMRDFDDARRLAILAATGVDRLILPRALDYRLGDRAELELRQETPPLFLYRILAPLRDAELVGNLVFAPHVNAGLEAVGAPGFDPHATVVLAGSEPPRRGPAGRAAVTRFEAERIEVDTESAAPGVLVVRRALLPIWEVEIDGLAAKTRVGNLTRLAVEVPAGRHRVRFFVDRRPFRIALGASLAGIAALLWMTRRRGVAT